jgi:AcrR family transcriptional regulator
MMTMLAPSRRRADQRRAEVIAAAVGVFAESGYAAPAAAIAARAGISEPYVFRLFGTKRQLFLACLESVDRRVRRVLEQAAQADGPPTARRERMLAAYDERLTAEERRLQLHAHAAAADPVIRAAGRVRVETTLAHLGRLIGEGPGAARAAYGELLLMSLADVLDLPRANGDADA